MGTATIRLDARDEATLDRLAELHGGRSNALREGLRLLAAATAKREVLDGLLADWAAESGPVSDDALDTMAERYGL